MTWRFFRLRRPVTIPWASLTLQFGSDYTTRRHFKKRFLEYLRVVLLHYPHARLDRAPFGLRVQPSPTHVPVRSSR